MARVEHYGTGDSDGSGGSQPKERAAQVLQQFRDLAQRRPAVVVAGGFAVGYVISRLVKRRRRKKSDPVTAGPMSSRVRSGLLRKRTPQSLPSPPEAPPNVRRRVFRRSSSIPGGPVLSERVVYDAAPVAAASVGGS